jgi:hypothetical protein
MTPEANRIQQQLRPLVLKTIDDIGAYETAKGWLRYEAVRQLDIVQLALMHYRAEKGESWDDMIDEAIANTPAHPPQVE